MIKYDAFKDGADRHRLSADNKFCNVDIQGLLQEYDEIV
jgi:hypothetical protein